MLPTSPENPEDKQNSDTAKDSDTRVPETTPQSPSAPPEETAEGLKSRTVPKSIRITEVADAAVTVLKGKYPKLTRAAIVSKAVIAYLKGAAAAPIVKYRMLHYHVLYPLQAAATDIKTGLESLGQQLYEARKSNRDPAALKNAFGILTAKQIAVLERAEVTLTKMDRECLFADTLTAEDHALLIEIIESLEKEKPTSPKDQQKRKLQLRILKSFLP